MTKAELQILVRPVVEEAEQQALLPPPLLILHSPAWCSLRMSQEQTESRAPPSAAQRRFRRLSLDDADSEEATEKVHLVGKYVYLGPITTGICPAVFLPPTKLFSIFGDVLLQWGRGVNGVAHGHQRCRPGFGRGMPGWPTTSME